MFREYMMRIKILLLMMLFFVSCEKDQLENSIDNGDGVGVEANLSLSVEAIEPGNENATRSMDMGDPSADIKNLWVIQLEQSATDVDKYVVVQSLYYSDYFLDGDETTPDGDQPKIMLKTTERASKILFIANTFKNYIGIDVGDSESAAQSAVKRVYSGPTNLTQDSEGNFYWMMNGVQTISNPITDNIPAIHCDLKRNTAMIVVNVTNNYDGAEDGITNFVVNSVQLHYIPKYLNYCTYHISDDADAYYPSLQENNYIFDYPYMNCNKLKKGDPTYSYATHMPTNYRRPKTGYETITSTIEKNDYAHNLATYMTIGASYKKGESLCAVNYKIYLGANLIEDFSIRANKKYVYNITIEGIDNSGYDARVIDLGEVKVDYTDRESSNCYILNPASEQRTFLIPVKNRLDEFWTPENGYVTKEEADGIYTKDAAWTTDIMWYDGATTEGLEFNPIDTDDDNILDAMQVLLPANFNRGNVAVAVKQGANIVWSWHFWITDYNPDTTPQDDGLHDGHSFTVSNGKVFKYGGSAWESGLYSQDVYAMDRAIGVQSLEFSDNYQFTALSYQFGRKDPFPTKNVTYTSKEYGDVGESDPVKREFTTYNFVEAVNKPTYLIGEPKRQDGYQYWYTNSVSEFEKLEPSIWFDYNLKTDSKIQKSIFDPSPLGWQVPQSFAYADMSTSYLQSYIVEGKDVGKIYEICGAHFLFYGYRDSGAEEMIDGGRAARIWSSTHANEAKRGIMLIAYYNVNTCKLQNMQHAITRNIYPITDTSKYNAAE